MSFKVGDRVRVLSGVPHCSHLAGCEGIIINQYEDGIVTMNIVSILTADIAFLNSELELLQPAAQTQNQPPHMANQIAAQNQNPQQLTFQGIRAAALKSLYQNDSTYEQFCVNKPGYSATVKLNLDNKCECGSHSVGVDNHSDYCPLYIKS